MIDEPDVLTHQPLGARVSDDNAVNSRGASKICDGGPDSIKVPFPSCSQKNAASVPSRRAC